MHNNAQQLFKKYLIQYFINNPKVLEVGPDTSPSSLQKLVNENFRVDSWHTLELESEFSKNKCLHSKLTKSQINVLAEDPYCFPVDDNTYDVVVSAFVIEHVPNVWVWIKELSRIIKNKGYLVTIAPTSWPYHEAPVDCWRIYPEGMKALYESANLEVITCLNDCLELNHNIRHFPGWTYQENFKNKLKKLIGWPVTAAYDTVAVGRKR
jgi:SAM-dependent methyltransferase